MTAKSYDGSSNGASRRRRGRPPHQPTFDTRQQVSSLAILGIDQEIIAKRLKVSQPTLRRHYANELYNSKRLVVGRLTVAVLKLALAGNPKAQIFWMRNKGGWTKPKAADNEPLPVKTEFKAANAKKRPKRDRPA